MILTCSECATRYSVDEAKFPSTGRQVRCAKCGHSWFQAGPVAEAEPAEADLAEPAAAAPAGPEPAGSGSSESGPAPESMRSRGFAAGSDSPALHEETGLATRLAVAAGWIGLIAVVLLIGYSAVRYRQQITMAWPQSAGVYSSLGMKVNVHGIDFDKVDSRHENQDGQTVLAVTGRIVNNSDRELPVPQKVRITLSDSSRHELYHWDYTPTVQTLKPGQSAPFITRISSPPAAARYLDVRFAKEGP